MAKWLTQLLIEKNKTCGIQQKQRPMVKVYDEARALGDDSCRWILLPLSSSPSDWCWTILINITRSLDDLKAASPHSEVLDNEL